jgi:hypothetical protein
MQVSSGGDVPLSAADLVGHLNCRDLTTLDLAVARGQLDKPVVWDPVLDVLAQRGVIHEESYLDHLADGGLPIMTSYFPVPKLDRSSRHRFYSIRGFGRRWN